jgi:hypothetical protein
MGCISAAVEKILMPLFSQKNITGNYQFWAISMASCARP